MKLFYEVLYRRFRAPWDIGPRPELVELVQSGRVQPCKAIDLGSGTASNCIFLAQHGFDVTGVDFAASAVELGISRAREAGVSVRFVRDDLTRMQHVRGPFELLVDYGTLDDLHARDRDRYVETVLRLSQPGSRYLLWCFEWPLRTWERLLLALFGRFFGELALAPGEAHRRFSPHFDVERIAGTDTPDYGTWPPGYAAYFMTRRPNPPQVPAAA